MVRSYFDFSNFLKHYPNNTKICSTTFNKIFLKLKCNNNKKNCKKFKKFTTIGHFCTNLVAFHLSLLSWLWPHWDPLIKTHTWPQVQQVWVWNTPHNGPITLCLRLCLSVLTLVILVHGQLLHLSDDSCGIVSLLQDGNYINI